MKTERDLTLKCLQEQSLAPVWFTSGASTVSGHDERAAGVFQGTQTKPRAKALQACVTLGLFFPFFSYMFPFRASHVSQKMK